MNGDLQQISRYRGALMGIAILLIVLFHIGLSRTDPFFGVKRMGNVGVDIFFLLSGIGLWYAWTKNPSAVHFYQRRLLRIFPAWLLVATAFYLPDYLGAQRFSSSIPDLIGDITINWDFWLHDELTFWYIPATMALYVVAPCYMTCITRWPVFRWSPLLMIVMCVAIQYVRPLHDAIGHIEIFWSRVPIFLIGIGMGNLLKDNKRIDGATYTFLFLLLLTSLTTCIWMEQTLHGRFPLFIERMLYIPLTISFVILTARLLTSAPIRLTAPLTWIGGISLEIYLLHCHFILVHIERWGWSYWPKALTCLALTLPAAWILHKLLEWLIRQTTKS